MHELALCQGVLTQVERIAAEHDARAVRAITLRIGPLAGVEPRLLEEAFTIARAGTVAAGATLTTEPLPVRVRCLSCGTESEARPNRLLCGHCGDWQTQLLSGDELLLASVELVTDGDRQAPPTPEK